MSRPRRPAPLYRVPAIIPPTPAEMRAFMPALTNRRVIRAQLIGVFTGATQLTITTQPSSAPTTGVVFVQQPVIQLRDASNNPVSQAGVTITASRASGSDTLSGTLTAVTNGSGVANFTDLVFTGTAGPNTIQFSATGLASVTSNSVTPTSSGFATPNIYNELLFTSGYPPFTDWTGGADPSGGPVFPTSVSRVAGGAPGGGTMVMQRAWQTNGSDDSARILLSLLASRNRFWIRFYYKLNAAVSTTMKFLRGYDSLAFGTNLGGLYLKQDSGVAGQGVWCWNWDQENSAIDTSIGPLTEAQVCNDAWHWMEIEFCRNGGASGFPEAQFWHDGLELYYPDGHDNIHWWGAGNVSYWSNKRLIAGQRSSSTAPGVLEIAGTLNGGNTRSGRVQFDRWCVSTAGRIGP